MFPILFAGTCDGSCVGFSLSALSSLRSWPGRVQHCLLYGRYLLSLLDPGFLDVVPLQIRLKCYLCVRQTAVLEGHTITKPLFVLCQLSGQCLSAARQER